MAHTDSALKHAKTDALTGLLNRRGYDNSVLARGKAPLEDNFAWLRDYLYISLGGNRKGRARTYANLLITMILGGLWHGAALRFVLWGALHGVALALHKLWMSLVPGAKEIGRAHV